MTSLPAREANRHQANYSTACETKRCTTERAKRLFTSTLEKPAVALTPPRACGNQDTCWGPPRQPIPKVLPQRLSWKHPRGEYFPHLKPWQHTEGEWSMQEPAATPSPAHPQCHLHPSLQNSLKPPVSLQLGPSSPDCLEITRAQPQTIFTTLQATPAHTILVALDFVGQNLQPLMTLFASPS